MKEKIKIGDLIELTHVRSALEQKLSKQKLGSQLLDYDGTHVVKISMPINENRIIPLAVGDDYQLCFFTNRGLYQCKGRVRKRYVENNIHVLDVILLTELKKYQRRKFYRLDCMFSIQYRIVTEAERMVRERIENSHWENEEEKQRFVSTLEKIPKQWQEGIVSDLSGGGLRFQTKEKLEKGSVLEVTLPLSLQRGIIPLTFYMQVIACINYQGSLVVFEIRGEFQNIKDEERETIVRYVFEEQRRRIRKD